MFYTIVYKLMYLGKRTRPDILQASIYLTTRTHNPTVQDFGKLYRIMEYLFLVPDKSIIFRATDPDYDHRITAYVDASFAIHPDMKSHTGCVIQLGTNTVFCKSSKQKLNSKSSTEAELIAVSDSLPNIIWCYNMIEAQLGRCDPVLLLQDNTATITMMERGRHIGESTRHINIRYFFIHHWISSEVIDLEYCPTELMIADVFTKSLSVGLYYELTNEVMGI